MTFMTTDPPSAAPTPTLPTNLPYIQSTLPRVARFLLAADPAFPIPARRRIGRFHFR